MSARSIILAQIKKVAAEQGQELAPLTDDVPLVESGLDSLALAILVARLEDILGIDPFIESSDVYHPTTLGDFVSFYEEATVKVDNHR